MKLRNISEANIATAAGQSAGGRQGATATDVAKYAGKKALQTAAEFVPGAATVASFGETAVQIFNMIRNRQNASRFIAQAMSLPDNQRQGANIFDIDDAMWDPKTGILSNAAKLEILRTVETELTKYVNANQPPPANFANNIAIQYLKSKVRLA